MKIMYLLNIPDSIGNYSIPHLFLPVIDLQYNKKNFLHGECKPLKYFEKP